MGSGSFWGGAQISPFVRGVEPNVANLPQVDGAKILPKWMFAPSSTTCNVCSTLVTTHAKLYWHHMTQKYTSRFYIYICIFMHYTITSWWVVLNMSTYYAVAYSLTSSMKIMGSTWKSYHECDTGSINQCPPTLIQTPMPRGLFQAVKLLKTDHYISMVQGSDVLFAIMIYFRHVYIYKQNIIFI